MSMDRLIGSRMWAIERKELDLTDNASAGTDRGRGHGSAANDVGEDHTNDVPEIQLGLRESDRANYVLEEQCNEGQKERIVCRGGRGRGIGRRRIGGEEHRNGEYNVKQNAWTGGVLGKHEEFSKSECVDRGGMYRHQAAEVADTRNPGKKDVRVIAKQGAKGQEIYITQLLELQNQDSSTLVEMLSADSHFASILNQITVGSHVVYVVARVLAEACGCTSVPGDLAKVLLTVAESRFYSHAQATLHDTMKNPHGTEEKIRQFIRDLLIFLIELSTQLPHSYMTVNILGLESLLKMTINQLEQVGNIIDEDIHLKITNLLDIKPRMLDNAIHPQVVSEERPPIDFREIPIFPTADDIYPIDRPFLQKNIDVGRYRDLDHYLDVQFRLLREDYICPLRDGIAEHLQSQRTNEEAKDINVYHDVHVIRTVCLDGGLLHRVKFDVSNFLKVEWDSSKRLVHSSLVCLSPDNFVTLLFATVSNRDSDMLRNGIIDLLFEKHDVTTDILAKESKFEMVESPAFFEAYRYTLQALQVGDFPFEKYIVYCNSDVDPPKYLRLEHGAFYDLRPLEDPMGLKGDADHATESMCAKDVEICNYSQWPSAEQLQLDISQHKAVQTALTKEFSIIQGPPGTGKTFIGLTIVKALLHNAHIWNNEKESSPILIVCYTNHALDQFLEGVVSFFKGDVLRVGGRMNSNCKALEKCSMISHKVNSNTAIGGRKYHTKVELLQLRLEIETMWLQIENAKCYILHEDILHPIMDIHYDCMVVAPDKLTGRNTRGNFKKPLSVMFKWLNIVKGTLKMDSIAGRNYFDIAAQTTVQRRYLGEKVESTQQALRRNIERRQEKNYEYDVLNLNREPGKQQKDAAFKHPKYVRGVEPRLKSGQVMPVNEANKVRNVWNLKLKDRWRLYRYWVSCFTVRLRAQIKTKEELHTDKAAEYSELQMAEDKQMMRKARVVGMTTTCAARYRQVLSEIGPKIVLVEEAAEVLEGHTITSLSKKCEHLILIGDHKQLKPNPTVYRLAKQFNLDLSLFERMVNNGIPCDTLTLQHRMRPEIANLMKKIYPHLQNHPSVFDYENMKGVSNNVFFVSHSQIEGSDVDMRSHSNTFEAEYVVALCVYFVKQGYNPSQITVLTTYSGQLGKLKQLMPEHLIAKENFERVTMKVVDNYQGEENDIIILSLVRSNAEGKVGFLKIENRICVALSRAKKGLFVIGNFKLLAKESLLWKEIVTDLEQNNMIGTSLNLYCQNHPRNDGIDAKASVDFRKAPEGGCMKKCLFRLECGHVCRLRCHPKDPQHTEYKCEQPCLKSCSNNHPCLLLCHQECGDCLVLVEKTIPTCGHIQQLQCFIDPSKFNCMFDCEKTLKCGHKQIVPCYESPMECICTLECEVILECGHICGKVCGQEHECTKLVRKTWRCGHTLDVPCMELHTATCTEPCSQVLQCGHTCQGTCHDCPWKCSHQTCTKKCSEPCNRLPCNRPCMERLLCGHRCIGLCGERCPRLCRTCATKKVTTIRFGWHSRCQNYSHIYSDQMNNRRHARGRDAEAHVRTNDMNTHVRRRDTDTQPTWRNMDRHAKGMDTRIKARGRGNDAHARGRDTDTDVRGSTSNTDTHAKEKKTLTYARRRGTNTYMRGRDTDTDVRESTINTDTHAKEKKTGTDASGMGTDIRVTGRDTDIDVRGSTSNTDTHVKEKKTRTDARGRGTGTHVRGRDTDTDVRWSTSNTYTHAKEKKTRTNACGRGTDTHVSGRDTDTEVRGSTSNTGTHKQGKTTRANTRGSVITDNRVTGRDTDTDVRGSTSNTDTQAQEKKTRTDASGMGTDNRVTERDTDTDVRGSTSNTDTHVKEKKTRTDARGRGTGTHVRGRDTDTDVRGSTSNTYTHAKEKKTRTNACGRGTDTHASGRDTDTEVRGSTSNTSTHKQGKKTRTNTRGRVTDTHVRGRDTDTHAKDKKTKTVASGRTDTHVRGRDTDTDVTGSTSNTDNHAKGKKTRIDARRRGTDTDMRGRDTDTDVRGSTINMDTYTKEKKTRSDASGMDTDNRVTGRDTDTDVRGSTSNTYTHAKEKKTRINACGRGTDTHVRGRDTDTEVRGSTSNTRTHKQGRKTRTHTRGRVTDTQVRGRDTDTHAKDKKTKTVASGRTDTHVRGRDTDTHAKEKNTRTDPRGRGTHTYMRGRDTDTDVRGNTSNMDTQAKETKTPTDASGRGTDNRVRGRDMDTDARGSTSNRGTRLRVKDTWTDTRGRGTDTHPRGRNTDRHMSGQNTDTCTWERGRDADRD